MNSNKVNAQQDLAMKIALILETEKCTVNESYIVLDIVKETIRDSKFTVRKEN
jgi:hypothetical protein